MAFTKRFSQTRKTFADATGSESTRGLVLNGNQVEKLRLSKLTGDTSGDLELSSVFRPSEIFANPILDNAGALVIESGLVKVSYAHVDYNTVTLSGLGGCPVAQSR